MTLYNYERAISAYIDYLTSLSEADAGRIAMFGICMGGYWGHHAATCEPGPKALASFEGVTGDFATILGRAQPTFKTNYMYMSGHTDAATFDRTSPLKSSAMARSGLSACWQVS